MKPKWSFRFLLGLALLAGPAQAALPPDGGLLALAPPTYPAPPAPPPRAGPPAQCAEIAEKFYAFRDFMVIQALLEGDNPAAVAISGLGSPLHLAAYRLGLKVPPPPWESGNMADRAFLIPVGWVLRRYAVEARSHDSESLAFVLLLQEDFEGGCTNIMIQPE